MNVRLFVFVRTAWVAFFCFRFVVCAAWSYVTATVCYVAKSGLRADWVADGGQNTV